MKKKEQNDKRSRSKEAPTEPEKPKEAEEPESSVEPENMEPEVAQEPEPSGEGKDHELETAEHMEFDEDMVEHLRVQTSLLEGREVSREEVIEMLKRVMRQHSMAPEKRRDYIVRFLKEKEENPP